MFCLQNIFESTMHGTIDLSLSSFSRSFNLRLDLELNVFYNILKMNSELLRKMHIYGLQSWVWHEIQIWYWRHVGMDSSIGVKTSNQPWKRKMSLECHCWFVASVISIQNKTSSNHHESFLCVFCDGDDWEGEICRGCRSFDADLPTFGAWLQAVLRQNVVNNSMQPSTYSSTSQHNDPVPVSS